MALNPKSPKRSRRPGCRAKRGYFVTQIVRGVKYGRIVCEHPHRRTLKSLGAVFVNDDRQHQMDSYAASEASGQKQCTRDGIAEAKRKWRCPESREDRKLRLAREQMAEIRKQAHLEEMVIRDID